MPCHLRHLKEHSLLSMGSNKSDPQALYSLVCVIKSMLLTLALPYPVEQQHATFKFKILLGKIEQNKNSTSSVAPATFQALRKHMSSGFCLGLHRYRRFPSLQKVLLERALQHMITYLTLPVIFGRVAVTFRAEETRDILYARGEMSDIIMS